MGAGVTVAVGVGVAVAMDIGPAPAEVGELELLSERTLSLTAKPELQF